MPSEISKIPKILVSCQGEGVEPLKKYNKMQGTKDKMPIK
jgi:hypothetical protein